ncbi:MAG: metallophosphoesterase [Planctomycetes bacterium]|nr:metallophosphoesterase [Planctomycetota bacterium]
MILPPVGGASFIAEVISVSSKWLLAKEQSKSLLPTQCLLTSKLSIKRTVQRFFLHLGDVVYGTDKRVGGYKVQFFALFKRYSEKVIAIPSNHDGVWHTTDKPLEASIENFVRPCQSQLNWAIFRQLRNFGRKKEWVEEFLV